MCVVLVQQGKYRSLGPTDVYFHSQTHMTHQHIRRLLDFQWLQFFISKHSQTLTWVPEVLQLMSERSRIVWIHCAFISFQGIVIRILLRSSVHWPHRDDSSKLSSFKFWLISIRIRQRSSTYWLHRDISSGTGVFVLSIAFQLWSIVKTLIFASRWLKTLYVLKLWFHTDKNVYFFLLNKKKRC